MTHTVVVSSDYFEQVLAGEITSEIRKVKTPTIAGDRLILQERDASKAFTGRELELKITSAQYKVKGLNPGFALVHFQVKDADAVTTTIIPAEAQVQVEKSVPTIDAGQPNIDLEDTLPLDETEEN